MARLPFSIRVDFSQLVYLRFFFFDNSYQVSVNGLNVRRLLEWHYCKGGCYSNETTGAGR